MRQAPLVVAEGLSKSLSHSDVPDIGHACVQMPEGRRNPSLKRCAINGSAVRLLHAVACSCHRNYPRQVCSNFTTVGGRALLSINYRLGRIVQPFILSRRGSNIIFSLLILSSTFNTRHRNHHNGEVQRLHLAIARCLRLRERVPLEHKPHEARDTTAAELCLPHSFQYFHLHIVDALINMCRHVAKRHICIRRSKVDGSIWHILYALLESTS
jgi:hypothetical protein